MKRNKKTGQNQPKPAKRDNGRKGRIFVSQVEQEVMRELHVKGTSTRKIAIITGRDRETVAKVIKASEWPKFIERLGV